RQGAVWRETAYPGAGLELVAVRDWPCRLRPPVPEVRRGHRPGEILCLRQRVGEDPRSSRQPEEPNSSRRFVAFGINDRPAVGRPREGELLAAVRGPVRGPYAAHDAGSDVEWDDLGALAQISEHSAIRRPLRR